GTLYECVDGCVWAPQHDWEYAKSGRDASRHAATVVAFVGDRIAFAPGRSVEAGITFDGVDGSADGAVTGISWHNVLPRVSLSWKQGADSHFTWVAGYRRVADRLTLDTLAVGDPAAPYATALLY